jgi:uncharacterized protein YdeI (BOF family)
MLKGILEERCNSQTYFYIDKSREINVVEILEMEGF